MVTSDLHAFVRANLPAPPARILEVGAGDGELARAVDGTGYDVLAIDPEPGGANVQACGLHELDEPPASFDAAVAVVSLHHVDPLAESLGRLATVLVQGAPLVIDEFDVGTFDTRGAHWWLDQRRTLGGDEQATAEELVEEHRNHLHPLDRIFEAPCALRLRHARPRCVPVPLELGRAPPAAGGRADRTGAYPGGRRAGHRPSPVTRPRSRR
jgi:SAM-dependent methyltransferase